MQHNFNISKIRQDFPILKQTIRDKPLVYLDSAASTQKPQRVIDQINHCYSQEYANIHRGVYWLSERATQAYEEARKKIRLFVNASSSNEIIFVRGTTEAINLVAQSYGKISIKAGDEILISHMEHHSNIVPWQILCEQIGAQLKVAPINESGELVIEEFQKQLSSKTRLVAITHISNAIGTINPIKDIVKWAHETGSKVLVDGAQAVPHCNVDVRELDCDFYAFSGHKLYGPTGIGVLYGKKELLDAMPPYQSGGDMISRVSFEGTTYNEIPYKFEAGTPHIAGVIGLGAAIDYLNSIDFKGAQSHEKELLRYATKRLLELPEIKIIGTAQQKAAVISFVLDNIHPHDVGTVLDQDGIALRAGHHCAQPTMDFFKVPATIRASFGIYNTREDVDALIGGLKKVFEIFRI